MKKFVIFALLSFFPAISSFAIYQPNNLGWINFSYSTSTVAVIIASTAPTIGYPIWCTDCAASGGRGTLCTSTGTTGSNQFILSTGTVCK